MSLSVHLSGFFLSINLMFIAERARRDMDGEMLEIRERSSEKSFEMNIDRVKSVKRSRGCVCWAGCVYFIFISTQSQPFLSCLIHSVITLLFVRMV